MAPLSKPSGHAPIRGKKKSDSAAGVIAPLVGLTLIAGVGGGVLGVMLPFPDGDMSASGQDVNVNAKSHVEKKRLAKTGEADAGCASKRPSPDTPNALKLRELPPIITNLGSPETAWVRLQAAIVYDEKLSQNLEILVSQIMSDVVAFLHATSLSSIQGADGLRRLHEELSDRASTRSENRIKEFIIETIVIQ
jgi:flagellar FliL protein